MRKWSLATAAVTVLAISACKGHDQQAVANDDLSRDLAAAASSDGLAMAPTLHNVQTVVSAEELSPQARVHRAPSARAPKATPHRAPHRDRVTPRPSTETASVTEVAVEAPEPSAPSDNGAAAPAARPQPVDVPTSSGSNGSGAGRSGGRGSGIGIGDIIGAIGGVIIRGGVVDGDHCDPRSEGRNDGRHGRPGNRYPFPGRPMPNPTIPTGPIFRAI